MKKDSLLKMKDLPATEEMLAVAREDVPVKVGFGLEHFLSMPIQRFCTKLGGGRHFEGHPV